MTPEEKNKKMEEVNAYLKENLPSGYLLIGITEVRKDSKGEDSDIEIMTATSGEGLHLLDATKTVLRDYSKMTAIINEATSSVGFERLAELSKGVRTIRENQALAKQYGTKPGEA